MAERKIPEIGKKAPVFALDNHNGDKVRLADLSGHWVILYFYPKDDTPGCTKEACEFTDNIRQFDKLNARIIGVSPDNAERHQKFIKKYKLKVTLLSDDSKKLMEKYGAFGLKKMYGRETMGVIRSTFLIDPEGKIAFAWPNVKAAGHADKVHDKLNELAG